MAEKISRTASSAAFEKHKDMILTLYKEMNLPQLVKFMQKEHNFVASQDMYKKRFAKWKAAKYNREDAMRAATRILVHRAQAGKDSRFDIDGREITVQDVALYWSRKGMTLKVAYESSKDGPVPANLICKSPPPMSRPMIIAKGIESLEGLLWMTQKYCQGYCCSFEIMSNPRSTEELREIVQGYKFSLICLNNYIPDDEVELERGCWKSFEDAEIDHVNLLAHPDQYSLPNCIKLILKDDMSGSPLYSACKKLTDSPTYPKSPAKDLAGILRRLVVSTREDICSTVESVMKIYVDSIYQTLGVHNFKALDIALEWAAATGDYKFIRTLVNSVQSFEESGAFEDLHYCTLASASLLLHDWPAVMHSMLRYLDSPLATSLHPTAFLLFDISHAAKVDGLYPLAVAAYSTSKILGMRSYEDPSDPLVAAAQTKLASYEVNVHQVQCYNRTLEQSILRLKVLMRDYLDANVF